MRSEQEILDYYEKIGKDDFLGFTAEVLSEYVSKEGLAKLNFKLKEGAKWTPSSLERESVIKDMREYMEFAWEKVEDHRGISANRSVIKMKAWLWLLGDEEMMKVCDDENLYPQYGAPILKKICEKYELPIPEGEDIERMCSGQPCRPGCENGCGT